MDKYLETYKYSKNSPSDNKLNKIGILRVEKDKK
jgi:hypothetical protein